MKYNTRNDSINFKKIFSSIFMYYFVTKSKSIHKGHSHANKIVFRMNDKKYNHNTKKFNTYKIGGHPKLSPRLQEFFFWLIVKFLICWRKVETKKNTLLKTTGETFLQNPGVYIFTFINTYMLKIRHLIRKINGLE